jgi:cytochrome c oxidase cbb3-type subunit 3
MSDFTSNFWSVFVTALTLVGIIGLRILLWMAGRKKVVGHGRQHHRPRLGRRPGGNEQPPAALVGVAVRSHHHLWLGYLAAYPGLGSSAGKLGWTQKGEYEAEVAKANKEFEPLYARFAAMTPKRLAVDPQAMAIGERLFMNNCAQCHGSDARGSKGFPNLADKDWLHGGTPTRSRNPCKRAALATCLPWLLP